MKCDTSFSPAAIIVSLTGCPWGEAYDILDSKPLVNAPNKLLFDEKGPCRPRKEKIQHIALPANFFRSQSEYARPGVQYLLNRGCWMFTMDYYRIHYCPSMKRVIFPLWHDGGYVGWQGRDISGEADLRYMTSKGFSKSKYLMGHENINKDANYDHVILTEGPVDCMRVAFLRNAVCSMGKIISRNQIELLRNLPKVKKIYLALDPDAFDVFDAVATELKPEKEVYLMQPPEGRKDFGECTDEEIMKAFKDAKRYTRGSMLLGAILRK